MRILFLCTLGLLLSTYACKKGDSKEDPNPNPPVTQQPTTAFKLPQYGPADLLKHFLSNSPTVASVQGAASNTGFSYEITGSNGMKTATDTIIKGTGTTDISGNASINTFSLYRYKDGTLTINIRFNNEAGTSISATTKKEEFIIRTYRDLMAINDFTGAGLSDTYVQTQDIAFPDTVLTTAPVKYTLKGNYDGRGYKITNLTIVVPSRSSNVPEFLGIFQTIGKQVTVKNVKLELSATGFKTPNDAYCGGIVGINYGTILNCSVRGSIKNGGPGAFSFTGGIAGETDHGRIIGCSFTGTLEGVMTGGITGHLGYSYTNMCYSNYSVVTDNGGGITGGISGYQDGKIHDTVYNCYAYVKQATVKNKLYSLFYSLTDPSARCIYDGCYSNTGIVQAKTLSYSTAQELNNLLLPLQVSNLPADIPAPPANKPFKNSGDQSQPPVLWWE